MNFISLILTSISRKCRLLKCVCALYSGLLMWAVTAEVKALLCLASVVWLGWLLNVSEDKLILHEWGLAGVCTVLQSSEVRCVKGNVTNRIYLTRNCFWLRAAVVSGLFGGSEKLNSWTSLCRLFKQGELVNLGWHQVPTKLLSHSTFSGQGKKTESFWVEVRTENTHQLLSWEKQTQLGKKWFNLGKSMLG